MSHNHSRISDSKVIGPGLWVGMHITASQARTIKEKKHCIWYIENLQKKFTCSTCKKHFADYLEKHPLSQTLDNDEESLFRWTVTFHNSKNASLSKPHVSYEQAKSMFWDTTEICTSCGEDEVEDKRKVLKIIPSWM